MKIWEVRELQSTFGPQRLNQFFVATDMALRDHWDVEAANPVFGRRNTGIPTFTVGQELSHGPRDFPDAVFVLYDKTGITNRFGRAPLL